MQIYSNCYFHFTKDFETLKKIIAEGIKVFFCKEEVYNDEGPVHHIGIPMASFCDIPLVYLTQNNYGNYCVGLSRRWGVEHQLQPVFYYPNNKACQSTQIVISATKSFLEKRPTETYKILGYSKPLYKIDIGVEHDDRSRDNYCEREWRKVYASKGQFAWKTEEQYEVYRGDVNEPKKPVGVPLKFSAEEVEFIIVHSADVEQLIQFIMHGRFSYIGGKENKRVTPHDRELLLSKVITYESLSSNM